MQNTIIDTLAQFGIKAQPGDITRGPTITRFEVYPDKGVRVDRITALERDIARATRAQRINILAPFPQGHRRHRDRQLQQGQGDLRDCSRPRTAPDRREAPPGARKDVYGKTIIADLAKMPHCLVAGTTAAARASASTPSSPASSSATRRRNCASS